MVFFVQVFIYFCHFRLARLLSAMKSIFLSIFCVNEYLAPKATPTTCVMHQLFCHITNYQYYPQILSGLAQRYIIMIITI